jgi:hypothetical protein
LTRVIVCPQCGYSLEGLPERGICPECGFSYSPSIVVLYGHGQGGKKTWSGGFKFAYIVYMAVILGIGFAMPFIRRPFAPFAQPVVVLLFAVGFALHRRQLRREMPAECQLRLTPDGFGERDGFGEVEIHAWDPRYVIVMKRLRFGRRRWLLRIKAPTGRFVSNHPIHFTFDADNETANRIRQHIDECRHGLATVAS